MLIIALLAAAICLYGLGDIGLMSLNEGRRAVPIMEMLGSGNWLLPHLNGELYITKPPLYYWLGTLASIALGSASEWSVRLPSALAALATLYACYRFMLRQHGAWPALFCVALLIANEGFSGMARRAELEMLLASCCVGSLLSALHFIQGRGGQRWVYLSYALLGLAVLTKGPVSLLFVTLPLAATAIHYRQPRAMQYFRSIGGWLLFLAIGGSWFLAVSLKLGFDVWHNIVGTDMAGKITGEKASEPVYSYLVWVSGAFLPAIFLLLHKPRQSLARWMSTPEVGALVYAFALPFTVFTLIGDKHAKYLLPAYPALAMLLALRLDAFFTLVAKPWQRTILGLSVSLPVAFLLFYAVGEQRVYKQRVEALPKVQAAVAKYANVPMYSHVLLDARIYFYLDKQIPVLDDNGLASLSISGTQAIVLAEHPLPAHQNRCELEQISPYFKKKKTLYIFGVGALCSPASRGVTGTQGT